MNNIQLQCVVWKEGRHFVAQCLNVDISSFGGTEKRAIKNLKEAVELYLEDTKSHQMTSVKDAELLNLSISHA